MIIGDLFLVNCGLFHNLIIMQGYRITIMKTQQTEKMEIEN